MKVLKLKITSIYGSLKSLVKATDATRSRLLYVMHVCFGFLFFCFFGMLDCESKIFAVGIAKTQTHTFPNQIQDRIVSEVRFLMFVK